MSPSTTVQAKNGCQNQPEKVMCSPLKENQTSLWIHDPYPPSISPLEKLNKIFVSDMIMGSHHRGSFILLHIDSKSAFSKGFSSAFDEMGNILFVRILHQDGEHIYNENLGEPRFLIVKEPYYKELEGTSDGFVMIYHITDIIALSPGDPCMPQIWERQIDMTADELRLAGNQAVKGKEYYTAIKCYNDALLRAHKEGDLSTIRLNRCYVRLSLQCFDAALEDANTVLANFAGCEKALFRKAEALYYLRRFKEAREILDRLTDLFPSNPTARQRLERVQQRLQEQAGIYDFSEMLTEPLKSTGLNRATFRGCFEVRQCKVKSRGRGLFLTKAVKVGELLLCEKAFSVSLMSMTATGTQGLPNDGLDQARDAMQKDCVFQLHRNPSLIPAFTELYSGYYQPEEASQVDGQAIIDGFLVDAIVAFNCYKFPQSNQHHRQLAHSLPGSWVHAHSAGLWILASYINHTCIPNVERAFIGDMIIIRAAQDMAAGSELLHNYVGLFGEYEERQKDLSPYGFRCTCRRCENEKATPLATWAKRKKILATFEKEISKLAKSSAKSPLILMEKILNDLDTTYNLPASLVPREEMCMEIFVACVNFNGWDMFAEVVAMVRRLLLAYGFHMHITTSRFRVTHWGAMNDFLVIALAFMWKAYGTVNPALCDDVEEVFKTAYEVVVGQRASFEDVYSAFRPLSKDSANGLERECRLIEEIKLEESD